MTSNERNMMQVETVVEAMALHCNVNRPFTTMTFSVPAFMHITHFTIRLKSFRAFFARSSAVAAVAACVTRLGDAAMGLQ